MNLMTKKKALFYEKKPEKIEKAKLELNDFIKSKFNSKNYKDELEKKKESLKKLIKIKLSMTNQSCKIKNGKLTFKENGFIN